MPRRRTFRRKPTKRKRTRKGGVRLGSNVIYPGIACEGKDPNTYATKLFFKGSESHLYYDEAKMRKVSEILKKIDPDQQYFLYPDFCDTKQGPLTKQNEEDIKGPREAYEEGTYDTQVIDLNKYDSYNMRNGKQTFADKWKAADKKQIHSYLKDATHLVEGLQKLHSAGILHDDMHAGNIVYTENGPPKFIDFDDCSVKKVTDEESKKEIRLLVGIIKRYL